MSCGTQRATRIVSEARMDGWRLFNAGTQEPRRCDRKLLCWHGLPNGTPTDYHEYDDISWVPGFPREKPLATQSDADTHQETGPDGKQAIKTVIRHLIDSIQLAISASHH